MFTHIYKQISELFNPTHRPLDFPDQILRYLDKDPNLIKLIEKLVLEFYAPVIYLIILKGLDYIFVNYNIDPKSYKLMSFPRDGAVVNRLFPNSISLPFSRSSLGYHNKELGKKILKKKGVLELDDIIIVDPSSKGGIVNQMIQNNLIDANPKKVFLISPAFRKELSNPESFGFTFLDTSDLFPFIKDREIFNLIDDSIELALSEPLPKLLDLLEDEKGEARVQYADQTDSPLGFFISSYALDIFSRWGSSNNEEKSSIISMVISNDEDRILRFMHEKLELNRKILLSNRNPISSKYKGRHRTLD